LEKPLSQVLKEELSNKEDNILLGEAACKRIDRLANASPYYKKLLLTFPEYWAWLEKPVNLENFRHKAYQEIWQNEFAPKEASLEVVTEKMLQFRKKMLLRIAFLIVNRLAKNEELFKELTLLAEFCVQTLLSQIITLWERRLGVPWLENTHTKARFCVLGLGKLGGKELNFFSDLDLIYIYEGNGYCWRDAEETHTSNREFFTHVCQDLTKYLSYRNGDSILYNIDLRLRPDGAHGSIAQTLTAIENYYSERGQTWEQLALMKARPIAGDKHLGEELLENLNTFRYPRSPSVHVLQEVASVKSRIEKEVVGQDNLQRDIKSGYGGIREIEFILQGLQLLNAGKNPFLQNASSYECLGLLTRYRLLQPDESTLLYQSYTFLREVENYLQLREEKQTHVLPHAATELQTLGENLGYDSVDNFLAKMNHVRQEIHDLYEQFFPKSELDTIIQDWFSFLCGEVPSPYIEESLTHWFKSDTQIHKRLRDFVLGFDQHTLSKNHVQLFVQLTEHFDYVFSSLEDPLAILDKIGVFAARYGARTQFLQTCSQNPNFFRALAMLFGRSDFIYRLLCQHPEIIEELLQITPKREKSIADIIRELELLPQNEDFQKYLWLYVKAEQVRVAIGELLLNYTFSETTHQLTLLAEAVLQFTLVKFGLSNDIGIVALGKLGGSAITFGSDLDLLLIARTLPSAEIGAQLLEWEKCVHYSTPLGRTFEIDFRLRPYGQDGPMIITLDAFKDYHKTKARFWEKQILTKARFVAGSNTIGSDFLQIVHDILYTTPISSEDLEEISKMLEKIREEKSSVLACNIKREAGGLMEIEFLAQSIQLVYGYKHKAIRSKETAQVFKHAANLNLITPEQGHLLLENYDYLSKLENCIRRNEFKGIVSLPESLDQQSNLAYSLGYSSFEEFSIEYKQRLSETRAMIETIFSDLNGKLTKA